MSIQLNLGRFETSNADSFKWLWMITHHLAELQDYKRGIFYNCISGLRSQPLQTKTHIQCKRYRTPAMYDLKFINGSRMMSRIM
jgi:hypothetical protein